MSTGGPGDTRYLVRNAPADIVFAPRMRPSQPPRRESPPPPPLSSSEPPRTSHVRARQITPSEPTPVARASTLVMELMAEQPGGEEAYLPYLRALGEPALCALRDHFPGPLWVDPRRALPTHVPGRKLSAIASCLVALGEAAVPHLAALLAAAHPDVRYFAAFVARDVPNPGLLAPLGQLALHPDPTSRRAALLALARHAAVPGYELLLRSFRGAAVSGVAQQVARLRAVQALAELRDAGSVPTLVPLLGDSDREVARAAHATLRRITAHDLGSLRGPWLRFVETRGGQPRVDWLLDGLTDRRGELRALAANELALLTGVTARSTDAGDSIEAAYELRAYFVALFRSLEPRR